LGAGGCDDGIPVVDGLLEMRGCGRGAADGPAGVLDAEGLDGPAVVLAAAAAVQLVAAAGAVLDDPEAALRVERQRLDVAVADRPDLGPGIGAAGERVVVGDRAVGVDVEEFAETAVEPLGVRTHGGVGAVAGGDEQVALGSERE